MRKQGICSKGENKIKPLGVEGCNSKMERSNLLDKEFKAMGRKNGHQTWANGWAHWKPQQRDRKYKKVPNRSHRAEENKFEVKNALEASIAGCFPRANGLLLPLVFMDGIAGSVVRPQAVKLSFVLRVPQASKVWEFGMSASSQVRKKTVLWADSPKPLKTQNVWHMFHSSLSVWREKQ